MHFRACFIAVCVAAASIVRAGEPVTNASASETWTSGPYVYDGMGNIAKIGTNAYSYDNARRISKYLPEAGGSQTFSYDSFGNVKRMELVPPTGGTPITRVIPIDSSSNQVAPSGGSVYDRAGNMLSHGGDIYKYDSQGMMIRLDGTSKKFAYVYTAGEERIGTVNLLTKQWVWTLRSEGGRALREYTSSGGTTGAGSWVWSRDYVYRGPTLLAAESVEGTRHYHVDHLGSPRLVTNGTGVKTAFHTYMPFGEEETSILQDRERARFTGHERDFNGGAFDENKDYLDYMHARYYNPTLGRFLSIDPRLQVKRALQMPQQWNRYSYVLNSPMKYTDPTGEDVSIGVNFTGEGWTDPQKAQILAQVTQWYVQQKVGKVYIFDATKQEHGRAFGSFLDGHTTISVTTAVGSGPHKPGKVFAGNYFADKSLSSGQQIRAISNTIVHETVAHRFHATYLNAQDQLFYIRNIAIAQGDMALWDRYGTVADSYAFAQPDTKGAVTNGPIPIHPQDLRNLQNHLVPVHAEPPEND